MSLRRLICHLMLPHWWAQRVFPRDLLQRIERAITASESAHRGELRLVVEANLPMHCLWPAQSTRARAVELFSQLRVWDTAENSGVLIYLQLIDRRVEIVADRGISTRVRQDFWSEVCKGMETAFRVGNFESGTLQALEVITLALQQHFPACGESANELPNAPLLL